LKKTQVPLSQESSRPQPIIAALQLPPFDAARRSVAWYEDFLLSNTRVFAQGGIKAVKVQDETSETGSAAEQTIARMAALGRLFRKEFPDLQLGIIVQAHDAVAPLAIADAADAHFVRLKIFVGSAVNAEGRRDALSVAAMRYRNRIGRGDIKIYADVHDRTAVPLGPVSNEAAALWAQSMGADCLVITGSSFDDTLSRVGQARAAGVRRPIIIGGGVTASNIAAALSAADAVVVSTALLRDGSPSNDMKLWDGDKVARLVEAAQHRQPIPTTL
jgi:predicted TIM-barrel enzyme